MGAIDTEDAARRLARVILSDIDLYIRERPKLGESREAQIEEGRRLFASRVSPELVPLFGIVLADRAAGRVNAPAVTAAASIPASVAAVPVDPVDSPPASDPAIEDDRPTDPSIFVPSVDDQPPPAAALAARAVAPAVPPPPPVAPARPQMPVRVPPAPPDTETPAAVAQARRVPPPAPEIPTPVLTARVSIPKLLAIVSVVAAIVAVLRLVFR